eukprot:GFYU01001242.1.p2 GENE.GFYU01001242.1~~GFYU01001242.1.p2  ORF type:complete len:235 (+),score=77.04 GFYU01001242.1:65-706(+)
MDQRKKIWAVGVASTVLVATIVVAALVYTSSSDYEQMAVDRVALDFAAFNTCEDFQNYDEGYFGSLWIYVKMTGRLQTKYLCSNAADLFPSNLRNSRKFGKELVDFTFDSDHDADDNTDGCPAVGEPVSEYFSSDMPPHDFTTDSCEIAASEEAAGEWGLAIWTGHAETEHGKIYAAHCRTWHALITVGGPDADKVYENAVAQCKEIFTAGSR